MKIEIKQAAHKFLNIDQATFKYYLGDELDNFMKGGEMTVSKRDIDRLYFQILERFEPHFREAAPIKPLSELIKDTQS